MTSVAALTVLLAAAPALADEWNERTTLTFSEAVMVPGATLEPGTYVFRIADTHSSRHLVQVFTEGQERLVTTTIAIPIKRTDPKGDIVLKFNPTEKGQPIALKGWFYPGSTYGHEFVYPEAQARHIAERTRTVVLSTDVLDSEADKATIRRFDPSGRADAWHGDAATLREWDAWRQRRAEAEGEDGEDASEATAPMMKSEFRGTRVEIGDLEENPSRYIGQTISVDAEVEDVFGPRLFTVDEPGWFDLDGELMVFMPTALAALVREDDRVTITGTVKPFVLAEVEREWAWLELEENVEVEFKNRPILVAERIVGGDGDRAMYITTGPDANGNGDSESNEDETTGGSPLTDASAIASGDRSLVGRHVELTGLTVRQLGRNGSFFVDAPGTSLLIVPTSSTPPALREGDPVSVTGVIVRMPDGLEGRLRTPSAFNRDIYIVASEIAK